MAEFIGGLIVGLMFALQAYVGQRRIIKIKDEHIEHLKKDADFYIDYSKKLEDKILGESQEKYFSK